MRCSQLSYWLRSARRAPPPISQWSPVHRASLRASSRQGSDVSHRWCSVSRPRTPSDGCDRQVCARFRSLVRKRDWSSGINVDVDGGDRDVGLALRALRAGARAGLEGACLCGLNPPLLDRPVQTAPTARRLESVRPGGQTRTGSAANAIRCGVLSDTTLRACDAHGKRRRRLIPACAASERRVRRCGVYNMHHERATNRTTALQHETCTCNVQH